RFFAAAWRLLPQHPLENPRDFLRGFSEVYPVPPLLLTVQWLPEWHGLQSTLGEAMSYCHYPQFPCRGLPVGIMHQIYPWNTLVDGAWRSQTTGTISLVIC